MSTPALVLTDSKDPEAERWASVSRQLESFARAWRSGGTAPDPASYLPHEGSGSRRLLLVELVKLDLTNRLQRGLNCSLEEYFRTFPDLSEGDPPCDLIYEDFHLRRKAGQAVAPSDYYRRFPQAATQLARMLAGSSLTHSTAVASATVKIEIAPGSRLDDFDLLALLGEGQFARVFLARQLSMQRLVALKVSSSSDAEAQTLAQLDHPNIVRVYDQRPLPDEGLHLVYMSYLPGGTLQNVLARSRSLPAEQRSGRIVLDTVDRALEARGEQRPGTRSNRNELAERSWPATVCSIGVKLAAALDYAHRHDVLHRDVKPANVLLTAEGEPLLADFNVGCCSKVDGAGPSAMMGGSLPYMAPEHLEAFNPAHPRDPESLDGRADVFGLAVTLWELLAGRRPFDVDVPQLEWSDVLEVMIATRSEGPDPDAVASIDEGDVVGLRDVLVRCLQGDPARRPATASEMSRELQLCLLPDTRRLLRPSGGAWKPFVRRHALGTLLAVGLAPNILAAAFNRAYNRSEIIEHWPAAEAIFNWLVLIVNSVIFPLAIVLVAKAILPVARAIRAPEAGDWKKARLSSLRLGSVAALVCVGSWVLAGVIWPSILRIAAGPPPQGPEAYVHFLLSLVVCGLIAAAYPYFLITFLAVRIIYPALLGPEGAGPDDRPALARVERELTRYRSAAAAVPLLAIALLASRGAANTVAVAVLCVIGLAGTLLAFILESRVRSDLAALAQAPASSN